jgi:hypothetical protein
VWQGGDPVTFSRVLDALNCVGIESQTLDQHRMSMFTGSRGFGYVLLVQSTDFARASEIVRQTLAQEPSA